MIIIRSISILVLVLVVVYSQKLLLRLAHLQKTRWSKIAITVTYRNAIRVHLTINSVVLTDQQDYFRVRWLLDGVGGPGWTGSGAGVGGPRLALLKSEEGEPGRAQLWADVGGPVRASPEA